MTPTERSLRLSAAMSEREMRMYRALRRLSETADEVGTAILEKHLPSNAIVLFVASADAETILAAIDAEILSTHSDPGPAPITTGA